MLPSYVKFLRGTISAFERLRKKDSDTLYFVSETLESENGLLYLGDKLIAGGTGQISLNDLADIIIDNIDTSSLLVYNVETQVWEAKPVSEIINTVNVMVGATLDSPGQSGLVPAPETAQQDLYLRGDATWANPTATLQTTISNIISTVSEDFNNLQKIETKIIELQNNAGDINSLGNQYYIPTVDNPTTIINEINNINEKLTWKSFQN